MKSLIVIDYTNDFVAPDGALTCKEPGQAIEGRIGELIRDFLAEGDFVVMAVDAHKEQDPYHPETGLYPPHNIIGTSGRNFGSFPLSASGSMSHSALPDPLIQVR